MESNKSTLHSHLRSRNPASAPLFSNPKKNCGNHSIRYVFNAHTYAVSLCKKIPKKERFGEPRSENFEIHCNFHTQALEKLCKHSIRRSEEHTSELQSQSNLVCR